jgi:hypothetical protein
VGVAAAGTSSDAGPSNLTSRAGVSADDGVVFKEVRKLLPDFTLGSYERFLKIFQRREDVILVSDEHDDVTEFKW